MQLYVLEGWDKIRDRVTKGASEVTKKGHRARHSKEGSEKSRENPGQRAKEIKRLKIKLGDTQRWAEWGQEKLRRHQERAMRQDEYRKRAVHQQEQIGSDLRKELEVLRARKKKEIAEGKAQLVWKEQELEESREYYRQGIRNLHTEVQQLQEENNTREEGHHQKENNTREEGHHQERETFIWVMKFLASWIILSGVISFLLPLLEVSIFKI